MYSPEERALRSRQATARWASKNKDKVKEYQIANRSKANAWKREWRKKNPGSTAQKAWKERNPEVMAIHNRKREYNLKLATPKWYEADKVKQVYVNRDRLNKQWNTKFQVDHIIPLNPKDRSVCGLHCWDNLQLLDKSLNNGVKRGNYDKSWEFNNFQTGE